MYHEHRDDPGLYTVAAGVVANAKRPGENITGFTSFDPQQAKTQLELLKEVIPGLSRVAILGDQAVSQALFRNNAAQARALGLQPQFLTLRGPTPDLAGAFEAAWRERAGALVVLQHPTNSIHRAEIAELAITYRLPTVFPRDYVDANWDGLLAYGTSLAEAAQHVPVYVDKILKGARPGTSPWKRSCAVS